MCHTDNNIYAPKRYRPLITVGDVGMTEAAQVHPPSLW